MPRSRRSKRSIELPWERRSNVLGGLTVLRRWRIGLLVALVGGGAYGIWREADHESRVRATRASIAEARRAVLAFRADIGRCPRSTVELVHPPRTGASYLNDAPDDGWDRPLWIRCPAKDDPNDVDVISAGPQGSFFDDDNIP